MPSVTDTASIQGRLLLFAFIVAGCILSFFFSSIVGWAFLAAVAFGIILLGNPRTLLMIYVFWTTISSYVEPLSGDNIVLRWSDEAMIGAMMGILFFNTEQHRRRIELRWINWSLVVLICLIGISGIANEVPKVDLLHFCLQYMRWYVVFFVAYIFLGNQNCRLVYRGLIFLFLMQAIPNAGWLIGINPMPNWMSGPDIAIGTGLGANMVAYFSIAFTCLGLALAKQAKTLGERIGSIGMMATGVLQIYFSYTVHAYILLAICLVIQLVISGTVARYFQLAAFLLCTAVLSVAVAMAFSSRLSSEYLSNVTPDYILSRWNSMLEGPKGQAYYDVLYNLPDDIPFPFIGAGPGNAGSNVAMQNRRPLADRYFNWVLLSSAAEYHRLSEGSSITSAPHTGILTFLSELGPLGLLAFVGIHVAAVWRVWLLLRRKAYTNRIQTILAEAFVPTMSMVLILAWIADHWYIAFFNNLIWIWAAVIWVPLDTPEVEKEHQP